MSPRIVLLPLLCIASLSARATAGSVVFDATGTVASVSAGAQVQYPGLMLNDVVHLRFEAFTPGSLPPPSTGANLDRNYTIDVPTFALTLGASTEALSATPTSLVGMSDLPDGVWLYAAPLASGSNLSFNFRASSNLMFTGADPLQSIGSWSGAFYNVFSFDVIGPGGVFVDINLNTFSIAIVQTGLPYCFGDGSGTPCPCGNLSPSGTMVGCLNGNGTGGKLRGSGVASVSADTLVLNGSQAIPFGPGLYFQGSAQNPNGGTFGNGLLCVAGSTPRLEIRFADALGASSTTVAIHVLGSDVGGDVRNYQMWYRDTTGFCTGAGYNLTNAINLTWAP